MPTAPVGTGRDHDVLKRTLAAIDTCSRLFIFLPELDGIAHRHGLDSEAYLTKLRELDTWLREIVGRFEARYSRGHVLIFSDHGMAPVTGAVELKLRENLGSPREKRYSYFLDSTMLRLWCLHQDVLREAYSFLSAQKQGHVLSEKGRQRFGVTNRQWGDVIYLLNEGLMFLPSFFGRGLAKAMHGYDPNLASQKGIILYKGPSALPSRDELSAIELHHVIKEILG